VVFLILLHMITGKMFSQARGVPEPFPPVSKIAFASSQVRGGRSRPVPGS
jgi:hypothetical protein